MEHFRVPPLVGVEPIERFFQVNKRGIGGESGKRIAPDRRLEKRDLFVEIEPLDLTVPGTLPNGEFPVHGRVGQGCQVLWQVRGRSTGSGLLRFRSEVITAP